MTGKRAFLELLKQEGVEILFGNPGTTELPLMDALATENELRYMLALQEAAVVAMADGYAQASGKLTGSTCMLRPGWATAWACSMTLRRRARLELTNPAIDFVALARALGIAAERTSTVADTIDLLRKALADGAP